ncbi:hypothetical protein ElyMa_000418400 [Elysia marginata]|uniref:Uncharacterized protein n=1 Tax=Elysia marginata TaxID=1093978 RepID=A0AAV4FM16_9GAST|nr:hypothetical protein ElyMa_000418400 [Elysia marginata]
MWVRISSLLVSKKQDVSSIFVVLTVCQLPRANGRNLSSPTSPRGKRLQPRDVFHLSSDSHTNINRVTCKDLTVFIIRCRGQTKRSMSHMVYTADTAFGLSRAVLPSPHSGRAAQSCIKQEIKNRGNDDDDGDDGHCNDDDNMEMKNETKNKKMIRILMLMVMMIVMMMVVV